MVNFSSQDVSINEWSGIFHADNHSLVFFLLIILKRNNSQSSRFVSPRRICRKNVFHAYWNAFFCLQEHGIVGDGSTCVRRFHVSSRLSTVPFWIEFLRYIGQPVENCLRKTFAMEIFASSNSSSILSDEFQWFSIIKISSSTNTNAVQSTSDRLFFPKNTHSNIEYTSLSLYSNLLSAGKSSQCLTKTIDDDFLCFLWWSTLKESSIYLTRSDSQLRSRLYISIHLFHVIIGSSRFLFFLSLSLRLSLLFLHNKIILRMILSWKTSLLALIPFDRKQQPKHNESV